MTLRDSLLELQRLLAAGDPASAAALCQRILVTWPGQAEALHALGLIAQDQGDAQRALDWVRQACAAEGARPVFFSNLAEMSRRAGLLQDAERAARHAVKLDPRYPGAWNNLGIVLQELGNYVESKACLERVLELQPDKAEGHNNYANTCRRMNLFTLAERHWLRALELRENYAETHSNLSTLYSDQGFYDRAAYHARRAIALAPNFPDAYINMAMVETARDDHAAALAALDRLLVFAPTHSTGLAAKALALEQLDRLEEALVNADQATLHGPTNGEAFQALGQLSQAAGKAEAARAAFERALALPGPAAQKAAGSLGVLLMEVGQSQAAASVFDQALARYPRSAVLYYNRSDLKRFTSRDDPDIGQMQALLKGTDQSANDRMYLHFALGNAFIQIGDASQAFLHLNEGNRLKRSTFSYDADTTSRWIASIARTLDGPAVGRLRQARLNVGGPAAGAAPFGSVFVIGMPRSGTTLVEQILASHPEIHGAGELTVASRLIRRLGDYPTVIPDMRGEQLRDIHATYAREVQDRIRDGVPPSQRFVVDKMPANFLFAGVLHAVFPDALIVHCRRDPADTCLSCYSKLFTKEQHFTYDQAELGQFYVAYQQLMAHWRAVLPVSHFLEVDYEDVVADLETQARRLISFLGLEWSASCLNFHKTPRSVRTASVNQVRRPIYKGSVARWRRFEGQLGPLLAALHAAPSSLAAA